MPLGKGRKDLSQSCLALPKSSTASQESAPATTEQMAMVTMSSNPCSRVRSMRGSVKSAKWWARDNSGTAVMGLLLGSRCEGGDVPERRVVYHLPATNKRSFM